MEIGLRQVIEVIWISVSTMGLVAALYGVVDVYKDYCAARSFKGRGGVSYLFARSNLRAQSIRSTKLFLLLIVGSISFAVQTGTPWRRSTLLLLLLVVTILTALDSIFDRIAKRKIIGRLTRGDDRHAFDVTGELPLIKREIEN